MQKRKLGYRRVRVLAAVLLVLATILAALPMTGAASDASVFDYQLQLAASNPPSGKVRVILQGSDRTRLAAAVVQQGGRVIRDLRIGDGLAVELPAGALSTIAQTSGARRITADAPMISHAQPDRERFTPASLATVYPWALMAPQLWQGSSPITGRGVGVVLIDSGIAPDPDLDHVVVRAHFGAVGDDVADNFGHGTAVAGVVGGNGSISHGKYVGIAPEVDLISLKVGDDSVGAHASDVIAAIRWAVDNKARYKVRVINLSLTQALAESYKTSLLDMAVEYAWFNGIVVVVAAGNAGAGTVLYPPANDPYVITVGATDDVTTKDSSDDVLATFSSYGVTQNGYAKPELVAPGRRIVTTLSSPKSLLATTLPDHVVDANYIRLSGTSFSAGEVSGVVAQVLQAHPGYKPDQVKWLLGRTAQHVGSQAPVGTGAGYPSAQRAVAFGARLGLANRGLIPNTYIAQAIAKTYFNGVSWDGVSWDGVSWDGVSWDGVSWDGVSWDGVSWDSVP